MTTIATLAALVLAHVPPSVEIAAVAVARGVPVDLALAVAHVESGNVPETRRDTVVSKGNIGRFQVNATATWRTFHAPSRAAWARSLQDLHVNIAAGVAILAYQVQRCGLQAAPRAYNTGLCGPSEAGDRYLRAVQSQMRRLAAQRRW